MLATALLLTVTVELPVRVVSGGRTMVMVSLVAKILAVVKVTTKS